jgi:putative photosynthetic complex assembly protein 2
VSLVGGTILCVVVLWWAATGALLYLNRMDARSHAWSAGALALLAVASLAALPGLAADASVAGHLWSFAAALAIWALNEHLFLIGWVTGPRRTAVPAGARGWGRFLAAAEIVIWHELALAASLGLIAVATWGGVQRTALLAFALLFVMRLSAKLNLFLGVPNLGAEFLPERLAYLASCFRRRRMNPLFPASVLLGGAAFAVAATAAARADAPGAQAGAAALAALIALAVIEHLFMVLPFRSSRLWRIADPESTEAGPAASRLGALAAGTRPAVRRTGQRIGKEWR